MSTEGFEPWYLQHLAFIAPRAPEMNATGFEPWCLQHHALQAKLRISSCL